MSVAWIGIIIFGQGTASTKEQIPNIPNDITIIGSMLHPDYNDEQQSIIIKCITTNIVIQIIIIYLMDRCYIPIYSHRGPMAKHIWRHDIDPFGVGWLFILSVILLYFIVFKTHTYRRHWSIRCLLHESESSSSVKVQHQLKSKYLIYQTISQSLDQCYIPITTMSSSLLSLNVSQQIL